MPAIPTDPLNAVSVRVLDGDSEAVAVGLAMSVSYEKSNAKFKMQNANTA
jgi:hypothetical protein